MLKTIIKSMLNRNLSDTEQTFISLMNNSLISGKPNSVPYLIDSLGQQEFIDCQKSFDSIGIFVYALRHNFATVDINRDVISQEQLEEYIFAFKLAKYSLVRNTENHQPMVKHKCGTHAPMFDRKALSDAHDFDFKLDVDMLKSNFKAIVKSLIAKMVEQRGEDFVFASSYEDVVVKVLQQYILTDDTYNLGGANLDWRGRSISLQLEKILNPVGYKVGRALVVLNSETITTDDTEAIESIYRFIANELIGACIGSTYAEKAKIGRDAYLNRTSSSDLVTSMWTQRIFSQLDELYANGTVEWNVPLEIDYNQSMGMVTGLLTGDVRLLTDTNVLGDTSSDAWSIDGCNNRDASKLLTAQFYGSSESLSSLFKRKFGQISKENKLNLRAVDKSSHSGKFAVIVALGELIKTGSNLSNDHYTVEMLDEKYDVEVQKTRPVSVTEHKYFVIVDGVPKMFKNSKVNTVKCLKQNRLALYTGLIHNLDSKIMNDTLSGVHGDALPIHDACLTLPKTSIAIRESSRTILMDMYNNRTEILNGYLRSVGVFDQNDKPVTVNGKRSHARLMSLIQPFTGKSSEFSVHAMK